MKASFNFTPPAIGYPEWNINPDILQYTNVKYPEHIRFGREFLHDL